MFITINKEINKNSIIKIIVITFITILLITLFDYKCPIHEYLGIYCPTCGTTRMLISFFSGDFFQSFRWNPLFLILFIILIIYIITFIIIYIKKKVLLVPSRYFIITLITIILLFMILRNIEIFSFLIPTEV